MYSEYLWFQHFIWKKCFKWEKELPTKVNIPRAINLGQDDACDYKVEGEKLYYFAGSS